MSKLEILQTKSDAEPWWFFEDWEKDIVLRETYINKEDIFVKYIELLSDLINKFPEVKAKNDFATIAFWNEEEEVFCEACDDDVQIYYGVLIMEDDNVMDLTPYPHVQEQIRQIINK